MMSRVVFACDESGAKGYADQSESYPGETGVFAGILVSAEREADASRLFDPIYTKYAPATGKFHIADLAPDVQAALRADIFNAIEQLNLPCFWYALHVEGLKASWDTMRSIIDDARSKETQTRVKRGSPRDTPPSMHEELFDGLYGHVIAFLAEQRRTNVDVEIKTDQIDSPIVKNFKANAARLLSDDPHIKSVTGWDTVEEKVVEGTIKVSVQMPASMKVDLSVKSITIKVADEKDGAVLAADVLANSLNHLFKHRNDEERYGDLNTPAAIAAHPLAKYLDAFCDWGTGDIVGDRLRAHPQKRQA